MKQPWFCEGCGADGTCTIPLGSGVFTGLATVRKAHARKSLFCDRIHMDRKVRVLNPTMMSRAQWRDFVKRSRETVSTMDPTTQLDYEERRLAQINQVLKQKNLTVKDCPCCGMSATLDRLLDEGEYTISCDNRQCGLQQVAMFTLEGAVAAWNRRSVETGKRG